MNEELYTLISVCLFSVAMRCSLLDAGGNQISINAHLCTHLRHCSLLDTGGNQINVRAYLRAEEIRVLRREFSATLVTLHVLGQELSSKSEILMLSTEFCSGLGLRNVLPASEDDVIHVLRQVYSATSTVLLQLGRGNLRL